MKKPSFESVDEYLAEKHLFDLGMLPTEGQNPRTSNLSHLANNDVEQAIAIIRDVDTHALNVLADTGIAFAEMSKEIQDCLSQGGRIFLCGCGATGRLSLALEAIWRSERPHLSDSVVGFMAGGDIALVRSVENFEDMPDFGARHLLDLGFKKGDLLISSTEGGETPFVIGATEEAARLARENGRKPFFTYCNPDEMLIKHVERSRRVIESPWIRKISITTGPMALSGSTRLQASTVQMLGAGLALLGVTDAAEFKDKVYSFKDFFRSSSFAFLEKFVSFEADAVKAGRYLLYETNDYGITILTDTTERSPTFSLRPFENLYDQEAKPCLSYLCLPEAQSSEEAWRGVLGRLPRGLDWPEYQARLSQKVALGFDFSSEGGKQREKRISPYKLERIWIGRKGDSMEFRFGGREVSLPLGGQGVLAQHLLLKLVLNIHSLLVMGRLGRYEKNVMTWVRPSNGKLIDRAVRYISYLLSERGQSESYENILRALFEEYKKGVDDEPVVIKVVERLMRKNS